MKYMNRLLTTYPILHNFEEKLSKLNIDAMHFTADKDQILKHASDSCIGFPFLIVGELEVNKISENGEETFLYRLKPGEVCHHAFRCIMEEKEYGIQVHAHRDSELIIFPLLEFKNTLLTDYRFLNFLYTDLFKKLDSSITDKEKLLHENVEDRLQNYLDSKKGKTIKTTHKQIAKEIGTAREVVSRFLKQKEEEGTIKLHRGSIEVY